MGDKTLDEHAAAVRETLMRSDGHIVAVYAAAYEAERAARVALEARVRELEARHASRERVFDACARAEVHQRMVEIPMWRERATEAEASAEALEAERLRGHNILVAVANALGASGVPAEALPAMIAETRAQLARLREAASELVRQWDIEGREVASSDLVAIERAEAGLMTALSTPGPTLEHLSLEQHAAAVGALAQRVQRAALDALESENKALRDRVRALEAETRAELAQLREAAGDLVRKARYGTDRVEDYQRVEAALARNVTPAPIDAWLEQLIASTTGVDEAMAVLLTLVRDGVAPSDPELFDKTRAAARTVTRAKLARETPK